MNPGVMMAVSAVTLVVSLVVVIANFLRIAKDPSILAEGKGFGPHLIGGAFASLATFGLVSGFIWFLVERLAT